LLGIILGAIVVIGVTAVHAVLPSRRSA
jgi:hypothetical protein